MRLIRAFYLSMLCYFEKKKKMQSLILLRFSEFYDSSITNYSLVLFTKIITIAIFPLHFHLVLYFSPSDNSQLQ